MLLGVTLFRPRAGACRTNMALTEAPISFGTLPGAHLMRKRCPTSRGAARARCAPRAPRSNDLCVADVMSPPIGFGQVHWFRAPPVARADVAPKG